jgi:phosphate transport system permease protein
LGLLLGWLAGPLVNEAMFGGDIRLWLDGQIPGAFGGWMLPFLPSAALLMSFISSRYVTPALRASGWVSRRAAAAWIDLIRFLIGAAGAVGIAAGLSLLVSRLGFDARGVFLGGYVVRNALVVGFVMGFAIIPIIYTLAEDALSTVPEHLRSASLGAGATPWQTAVRVIVPTAMSGLFSAVMVGLGRAVGETMIVLMAAGNTPILDMNLFNGFRTLSANLAVELPEAVPNSSHYRILFLAALTLFGMTFVLNTVAEIVRQRFRKRAYQL